MESSKIRGIKYLTCTSTRKYWISPSHPRWKLKTTSGEILSYVRNWLALMETSLDTTSIPKLLLAYINSLWWSGVHIYCSFPPRPHHLLTGYVPAFQQCPKLQETSPSSCCLSITVDGKDKAKKRRHLPPVRNETLPCEILWKSSICDLSTIICCQEAAFIKRFIQMQPISPSKSVLAV